MTNHTNHREALLEVRGLQTAYGTSQVLFGIDVRIGAGEVATLLGRNGMGKTTNVRSILGLTRSQGGEARFLGERIDGLAPDRIARMGLAVATNLREQFSNGSSFLLIVSVPQELASIKIHVKAQVSLLCLALLTL